MLSGALIEIDNIWRVGLVGNVFEVVAEFDRHQQSVGKQI